ncbi:MAG: hypothetical protein IIZ78_00960 [Clostridiales bacterium]|nr:hypothetical protein [Clostridiales bacterium]
MRVETVEAVIFEPGDIVDISKINFPYESQRFKVLNEANQAMILSKMGQGYRVLTDHMVHGYLFPNCLDKVRYIRHVNLWDEEAADGV